jgi:UDP-3-O-[3-hydroxymyristoyl] glucosamine N-acyltransferase
MPIKKPFLSEERAISSCGSHPFSLSDLALWGNAVLAKPVDSIHSDDLDSGRSKALKHTDGDVNPFDESLFAASSPSKIKTETPSPQQSSASPETQWLTDLSRDFGNAQPHQVTFLADEYRRPLGNKPLVTFAGACFVKPQDAHFLPLHTAALITPRPYRSFVQVLRLLDTRRTEPTLCSIHASAHIHASAKIDPTCYVGPGVIIEKNVTLGAHTRIGAFTHIGENVHIGHNTTIGPHVSIEHSSIGNHVHIQTGARIGHIGFGFVIDDQGFLEIPHQGKVILGNYVHIGANSTISRGSFTNTTVGDHTRIDALVQIAHNVQIGQHVVIASQCGIAGSCQLGDGCFLGGQVGLANGVLLAPGTKIAAKSGVMHSTHTAETLAGIPAVPVQQWRRSVVFLAKWGKKSLKKETITD